MFSFVHVTGWCSLVAAVFLTAPRCWGDPSRDRTLPVRYSTEHAQPKASKLELTARVELDPVLFPLNSLEGTYRIVRVEVRSLPDKRLDLSAEDDAFTAVPASKNPDRNVPGVLDLAVAAPKLWDGIAKERRARLAYPRSVEPKGETSVFVYIPADKLAALPDEFEWRIADGKRTLKLARPIPTKD